MSTPALVVAASIPYRTIRHHAYAGFAVSVALLAAVYLFSARWGSRRWIPLGLMQFQPSELAKMAFAIWGAHLLAARRMEQATLRQMLVPLLPAAALALTLIFMLWIAVSNLGSGKREANWVEPPLGQKLRALAALVPPAVIFGIVMGSIYAGFATPTESAAIGVIVALIMAALMRQLSVDFFTRCFINTARTTGMVLLAGARLARWYLVCFELGCLAAAVFLTWLQTQSLYVIGALCIWCMCVWAVTIPIVVVTTARTLSAGAFGDGARRVVRLIGDWKIAVIAIWYLVVITAIALRFYREFALMWFGIAL